MLNKKKLLEKLINVSVVIVLILSIYIIPLSKIEGAGYTTCQTSVNNFDTTQTGTLIGTAFDNTGTITQNGNGIIDCITNYDFNTYWDSIISASRDTISFTSNVNLYCCNAPSVSLIDRYGTIIMYATQSLTSTYTFDVSTLSDDTYFVLLDSFIYTGDNLSLDSFIVYNGLIYKDVNDISQEQISSLDPSLGSLNFGLAIVIVLISLSGIFSIYNLFSKKKKIWQM